MGVVATFLALFAASALTVFSIRKKRDQARQQAAEALAQRLGLSFHKEDSFGLLAQLKDFDLFHRERRWLGRNGRVRNILRGTVEGTEVFLFEYTYLVSTGKSTHRVSQTVFFANDKNWYLPNFRLKPETWWHKVRGLFDKSDIQFPDNPEFSDQFWVTGQFDSLIRKTFSPDIQQFLSERPPVHLEGNNFYLLAYKPGTLLPPESIGVFFQQLCHLVALLKKEDKMELLNLAEIQALPAPDSLLREP